MIEETIEEMIEAFKDKTDKEEICLPHLPLEEEVSSDKEKVTVAEENEEILGETEEIDSKFISMIKIESAFIKKFNV